MSGCCETASPAVISLNTSTVLTVHFRKNSSKKLGALLEHANRSILEVADSQVLHRQRNNCWLDQL